MHVHRLIARLATAGLLLAFARGASAQDNDLATAVKATYVAKFAPFVAWPDPVAEFPGNVFPLCIAGNAPGIAGLLQNAANGQTVAGHQVVVRILPTVPANPDCDVLYVPASQTGVLNTVRGKPILTVTDEAPSADTKGIINFVIRDNRVRFEIDEAAAVAAGLVISSKLLSLAVSVHPANR